MGLTTNENQELIHLEIFISNKITTFSSMTYPKEITDGLGEGAFTIIQNFMRDGVIAPTNKNFELQFTIIGHRRYKILKSKKNSDTVMAVVIWITLIAAVVSAFYAILQYYKPDTLQSKQAQAAQDTTRKKLPLTIRLAPDTIKAVKVDSVKKKGD